MHYYKYLPFHTKTKTELFKCFEKQDIRIDANHRTAEVEYMGIGCELSYSYNSGTVTYTLTVYPTLTGYSVDGTLSRRNTSEWMKTLYDRMKKEYGEPSALYLFYGHLNEYDEVETKYRYTDKLNPSRADESIHAVFDNVELSHSWFDHDGDLTSDLTVTFRPETKENDLHGKFNVE